MPKFNGEEWEYLAGRIARYALQEYGKDENPMAKRLITEEKAKKEIMSYYTSIDKANPNLAKYSRNLNLLYMQGKLDPCYHRDVPITAIQKILLRKNKANVLLTGAAGCGKTAIAEGLAAIIAERNIAYTAECIEVKDTYKRLYKAWEKKWCDSETGEVSADAPPAPTYAEPHKPFLCDCVIYDLSLNALVSGTKYRGEFEENVQAILNECKQYKEVILFIDEIHQIVKTGGSDGSEGLAQILKPALARNDIRVIGATTTDETKLMTGDKALMRRFCEVAIQPLAGVAAMETAEKILADYCQYHKVVCPTVSADELLQKTQYFLPNTVFPDNFINIVDETLAGAVFDGLKEIDITHFNATIGRMANVIIV